MFDVKELQQLQTEQAEWSDRNFGIDRDPSQSLLGMTEELGELGDALNSAFSCMGGDRSIDLIWKDIKDAIADLVIFSLDYCNLKGWNMADVFPSAMYFNRPPNIEVRYRDLASACGRAAHHHLKLVQGIRGTPEEHEKGGREAMAEVLFSASRLCTLLKLDFSKTVWEVWETVRKRDWKKDSVTACGYA